MFLVFQGQKIMMLEDALTPAERANYIQNGILPSRLMAGHPAVAVNAGPQLATNGRRPRLRNARKRRYRVISRWKYLLEKATPAGFNKIPGLNAMASMVGNTPKAAVNVANSELGQEAIKMGVSTVPGGGAAVKAYENKSQIQSGLTGAADLIKSSPQEQADFFTLQNMKDLATSDAGQEVIKMGVSCLPGGGVAVKAYENGSKLESFLTKTGIIKGLGKKKN